MGWAEDEDKWRSKNDPTYPGYRELHSDPRTIDEVLEEGVTTYDIRFTAPPMSVEKLPNGTHVIHNVEIVSPKRWKGQRRELTVYPDGSIHLGPNKAGEAK